MSDLFPALLPIIIAELLCYNLHLFHFTCVYYFLISVLDNPMSFAKICMMDTLNEPISN